MRNTTFRGRGLTARFLYSMPASFVGTRNFESRPVPETVYQDYEQKIVNLLEDEYTRKPELITLSEQAAAKLSAFASEIEPRLVSDLAEMSDWAGSWWAMCYSVGAFVPGRRVPKPRFPDGRKAASGGRADNGKRQYGLGGIT